MSEREPLVPADCDLRGLPWMPIDTVRLLDSDLFALSKGDEFKVAVRLWCKAWHQVPSGSLPSDDRILAELSGMGRLWPKVKTMALRGFVPCSDGRLYHPVIAEKAMEAWLRRDEFLEKNKNTSTRQQRWRARQKELSEQLRELGVTPPVGATLSTLSTLLVDAQASPSTSTRDAREMPLTGTGTGQVHEKEEKAIAPSASRLEAGGRNGHDLLGKTEDQIIERIPLCDGTEYGVPKTLRDELDRLYPAVDPDQTLREIRGWCIANPRRRKTVRGVKGFITSWFSREQDKQSRRAS